MSEQSVSLGGEGGTSFQFNTVGDAVTGTITKIETGIVQKHLDGRPKTFDDGQAMTMIRVTLQTDLTNGVGLKDHDPSMDDDGRRSIYLRGSKKPDARSTLSALLLAARKATRSDKIDPGGRVTMRYVGEEGDVGKRRKLYEAEYAAPSVDLGGGQQQQAAPQASHSTPALNTATTKQPYATGGVVQGGAQPPF